jgi:hypothetical protein
MSDDTTSPAVTLRMKSGSIHPFQWLLSAAIMVVDPL